MAEAFAGSHNLARSTRSLSTRVGERKMRRSLDGLQSRDCLPVIAEEDNELFLRRVRERTDRSGSFFLNGWELTLLGLKSGSSICRLKEMHMLEPWHFQLW
ncbi:hypothetical protein Peur_017022 [Populus x canadensis]